MRYVIIVYLFLKVCPVQKFKKDLSSSQGFCLDFTLEKILVVVELYAREKRRFKVNEKLNVRENN